MKNIYSIIKSSTDLKKSKNSDVIDSECLFGEKFKLIRKEGKWSYGISVIDNYYGWVETIALGIYNKTNYTISTKRSCLLTKPDVKSSLIQFLPIRSNINVIEIKKKWAKINIFNNKEFGYVFAEDITCKTKLRSDWVFFSELLIGTPYRWGGRNSIGIDCSSLLQLSKAFEGENLPRDTSDQFKFFTKSPKYKVDKNFSANSLSRGDILYWVGHIAIIVNSSQLIHASGYHGKVLLENIDDAINRINKETFLITKIKY